MKLEPVCAVLNETAVERVTDTAAPWSPWRAHRSWIKHAMLHGLVRFLHKIDAVDLSKLTRWSSMTHDIS
jgi:hypothetical protein